MAININIDVNTSNLLSLNRNLRLAQRRLFIESELDKQVELEGTRRVFASELSQPVETTTGDRRFFVEPGYYGRMSAAARLKQKPAARNGSIGNFFLCFINVNAILDDVFSVSIGGKQLTGNLDFSPDEELTAFLYTWKLSDSLIEKLISHLKEFYEVESAFFPIGPLVPTVYRQPGVVPASATPQVVFLKNIKDNNAGNRFEAVIGRMTSSGEIIGGYEENQGRLTRVVYAPFSGDDDSSYSLNWSKVEFDYNF